MIYAYFINSLINHFFQLQILVWLLFVFSCLYSWKLESLFSLLYHIRIHFTFSGTQCLGLFSIIKFCTWLFQASFINFCRGLLLLYKTLVFKFQTKCAQGEIENGRFCCILNLYWNKIWITYLTLNIKVKLFRFNLNS